MPLPLSVDANGVAYMAYDSTNDRARVESGIDAVAATATFTQTNASFNYVSSRDTSNYRYRSLIYLNTTDKTLTLTVQFKDVTGGALINVLQFTIVAGNVTPQQGYINPSGAFASNGTAPTKVFGDYSILAMPGGSGALITIFGSTTAATVGSSEVDFSQSTL